ncbi:hypothetical protein [Lyngbya sp. CCY1209]|uniref:hypothetical protein n=1 Tax=Lyngbya sp. CCY1209 TaxID=2886103 RepID=UPI002D2039D4|nr:hypothetical protein [Lyngbya sp. CCY1209]MEB3886148.1 hypothetical protein [Lyngbya sp. CCY1209]
MISTRDWQQAFLQWLSDHEASVCSLVSIGIGTAGLWWASLNPGINPNRFWGVGIGWLGGTAAIAYSIPGIRETERSLIRRDIEDGCFDIVQVSELAEWENEFLPPPDIGCGPDIASPPPQAEIGESREIDFYNPADIPDEACGIILGGNSGSAKTLLGAGHLAGLLTRDRPAEVIVLDLHASRNPIWEQMGYPRIVDDPREIFAIARWFIDEIERRKRTLAHPIVLLIDEVNDTLSELEYLDEIDPLPGKRKRSKIFSYALRKLGNARKFDIILIAFMLSHNTEAIGIDGKFRNNFLLILTGSSARAEGETKLKHATPEYRWLQTAAYPCVVSGSAPFQLMEHPTHKHHTVYRAKGNAPQHLIHPHFLNLRTVPDFNESAELTPSGTRKNPKGDPNPRAIDLEKPPLNPNYPDLSPEQIRILEWIVNNGAEARLGELMRSITITTNGEKWTKDKFLIAVRWMEDKGYLTSEPDGTSLWLRVTPT